MFLVKKTGVVFKDWTEITENTKQTGFFIRLHCQQMYSCFIDDRLVCVLVNYSKNHYLIDCIHGLKSVVTKQEINMHIVYIYIVYIFKKIKLSGKKKIHISLCSWILITLFKDLPWLVMFKAEMNVSHINLQYVQPPTFLSTEGI